jgi:hypothetical protein
MESLVLGRPWGRQEERGVRYTAHAPGNKETAGAADGFREAGRNPRY